MRLLLLEIYVSRAYAVCVTLLAIGAFLHQVALYSEGSSSAPLLLITGIGTLVVASAAINYAICHAGSEIVRLDDEGVK